MAQAQAMQDSMSIFKVEQSSHARTSPAKVQGGLAKNMKKTAGPVAYAGKKGSVEARKFDGSGKGVKLELGPPQGEASDDDFERY